MHGTSATTHAWRPSRWVVVALLAWGLLGAPGLLASALPRDLTVPAACVWILAGAWQSARFASRALRNVPLAELDLHWRGPLAFDARTRLSWWPDTLDAQGRRALRLATSRRE